MILTLLFETFITPTARGT